VAVPGPTARPGDHRQKLRQRLHVLGIDRLARVAALDHLTSEIPAPVLADLTGYNPRVIAR
jgi:hypothetical protein